MHYVKHQLVIGDITSHAVAASPVMWMCIEFPCQSPTGQQRRQTTEKHTLIEMTLHLAASTCAQPGGKWETESQIERRWSVGMREGGREMLGRDWWAVISIVMRRASRNYADRPTDPVMSHIGARLVTASCCWCCCWWWRELGLTRC